MSFASSGPSLSGSSSPRVVKLGSFDPNANKADKQLAPEDIAKLDIQKLHLEVNQLRYFELLCCSFAIVLVSAAAPAFDDNPTLGIATVLGVSVLAGWHSTIVNVRSRLSTYLRWRGWSFWESDYREFANKVMGGSQRDSEYKVFLYLVVVPLVVYVFEHHRILLHGLRSSWFPEVAVAVEPDRWIKVWVLVLFTFLGVCRMLWLRFGVRAEGVLEEYLTKWGERGESLEVFESDDSDRKSPPAQSGLNESSPRTNAAGITPERKPGSPVSNEGAVEKGANTQTE